MTPFDYGSCPELGNKNTSQAHRYLVEVCSWRVGQDYVNCIKQQDFFATKKYPKGMNTTE